jgi:hypothetical protein
MGHEVWGVYGVRDHLRERAFVADSMLYDRLVLPVPPGPESPEHDIEWARWTAEGWQPAVQQETIEILGDDLVYPVDWNSSMRRQWEADWAAAQVDDESASPYVVTGGLLTRGLPRHGTDINAVAAYASADDLQQDAGVVAARPEAVPAGKLLVVLGREFLVPDPDDYRSPADQLLRRRGART